MNAQTDIGSIYQQFREPLKNFISKRIADEATAEDILHDLFVRIHDQLGSLKEKEKLAPWLYSIARNAVIDFYRKKRVFVETPDDLALNTETFNDVPDKLFPVVRSMADRLPDNYREALLLSDFEGLKQAVIAERLGISLPGAKSRIQRARKMLKDLLLECCHFEFDRYGNVFDYRAKNCHHCCGKNESTKSC